MRPLSVIYFLSIFVPSFKCLASTDM